RRGVRGGLSRGPRARRGGDRGAAPPARAGPSPRIRGLGGAAGGAPRDDAGRLRRTAPGGGAAGAPRVLRWLPRAGSARRGPDAGGADRDPPRDDPDASDRQPAESLLLGERGAPSRYALPGE